MQVICTDGTVFTCEGFELTEYGVALYGQNLAREKERYDGEPEQTGYVPHDRLWYVLPDDVEPNLAALPDVQGSPQGTGGQAGTAPPPSGGAPVPGQSATDRTTNQAGTGQSPPGQPPGSVADRYGSR